MLEQVPDYLEFLLRVSEVQYTVKSPPGSLMLNPYTGGNFDPARCFDMPVIAKSPCWLVINLQVKPEWPLVDKVHLH